MAYSGKHSEADEQGRGQARAYILRTHIVYYRANRGVPFNGALSEGLEQRRIVASAGVVEGREVGGRVAMTAGGSVIDGKVLHPDASMHPVGRSRAVGQKQRAWQV